MSDTEKRLVAREYEAARFLFAVSRVIGAKMPDLKRRFEEMTRCAWNEIEQVAHLLEDVKTQFRRTIPESDWKKLKHDLTNTDIYMHTVGPSKFSVDDKDMVYITRDEVRALMEYIVQDCGFCDKDAKAIEKCKKRRAIAALFTHEIPGLVDGECIWNEYGIKTGDARKIMLEMQWEDRHEETDA